LNNAVNKFDSQGLTSYSDIDAGRVFYTWHMGWIDAGHAFGKSNSLRNAWEKISKAKGQELVSFRLTMNQRILNIKLKESHADFCLKVKNDMVGKKNQLLYAWMIITNQFEGFQSEGIQDNTFVNKIYGSLIGEYDKIPSGFSTEDLISNLLNFYSIVDSTPGEDLANQYAGRFLDSYTDEKIISKAIWLFSLKPRKGGANRVWPWQPSYFDYNEFLAKHFMPNPMACAEKFGIGYARIAQERLRHYLLKFGEPTFPKYFQKYTPTNEGYISIDKTNKSLF
jgi:hypothetical protein